VRHRLPGATPSRRTRRAGSFRRRSDPRHPPSVDYSASENAHVHLPPRVFRIERRSGSIRGDVKRKSSRIELKPGEKFIWHPAPARSSCRGAWPKMRPAGNSSVGRVCSHRGQRDCRLPTVGTRARQVVGRRTCSGRRRRFLVSCFPSCLGESCFRTARSGQGRAGRRGGAGP